MARSVTMASLESQVRKSSDTENATGRFPQTEVFERISSAWAELYNHIIKQDQHEYLNSSAISVTAGTNTYALPSDFYVDKGCDVVIHGQTYVLDRWQWEERDKYDSIVTWTPGHPWAYAIIGNNIQFRPTPSGAYSVNLWYYPAPAVLTSASGSIDCKAGFEEFIIADAAAKIMAKDDRDNSERLRQKAEALRLVDMMTANRSRSNPNRVIHRWRRGVLQRVV